MRISSLGASARNAFYDRNPLNVGLNEIATRGPSGVTTRWSYTTPTGRKLQVTSAHATLNRVTVATTAAFVQAVVFTAITQNAYLAAATGIGNNLIDKIDHDTVGTSILQLAGGTITGSTSDASTGGTTSQEESFSGVEFDA